MNQLERDMEKLTRAHGYIDCLMQLAVFLEHDGYEEAARDLQTFIDQHSLVLTRGE